MLRTHWATYLLAAISFLVGSCGSGSDEQAALNGDCSPSGEYSFVCGLQNPEDVVLLPDSSWVIASSMALGAPMYLIDADTRQTNALYPGTNPQENFDTNTYQTCPGEPDLSGFLSHGLNVRTFSDGRTTLYVVGHGEREAIEVFDIDMSSSTPSASWIGCVLLPEGLEANSVASFDDGSLIVTVPVHPEFEIGDAFAGESTGAVYGWSPGDRGFERIEGTDLPFPNGIEVAADGSEFFVASTTLATVIAFSRGNPSRQLRTSEAMSVSPDNLRMGADGRLITAGMLIDDPVCGAMPAPENFSIELLIQCPRGFEAVSVDPVTMEMTVAAQGSSNESFANATIAIEVGDEFWVGAFAGDRLALVSGN